MEWHFVQVTIGTREIFMKRGLQLFKWDVVNSRVNEMSPPAARYGWERELSAAVLQG